MKLLDLLQIHAAATQYPQVRQADQINSERLLATKERHASAKRELLSLAAISPTLRIVEAASLENQRAESKALTDYLQAPEIKKSDALDWLWDLIEKYKQFIDTLSPDELVALFNIIGYSMILDTLISICLILAGNILIERLNLKAKYPRFSKILEARSKLSKASLWIYVIILFSLILIFMGVNFYMLTFRYFH